MIAQCGNVNVPCLLHVTILSNSKRRNSCHFELGDWLCLDSKVTLYNNSTFALLDSISRPKLQHRVLEHYLAQALAMDIPRLGVLSMVGYTAWK
jgi:hypothetical protein